MTSLELFPRSPTEVVPGAILVPDWLGVDEQAALVARCREWARPPAGIRRPRMPDGTPLSIRSVCLGWHWYPYAYSRTCDDGDGAPVKPLPADVVELGQAAVRDAGFGPDVPDFDSSIINVYDATAKLGLHRDDLEAERLLGSGSPVVTISLGDSCVFRFGNTESRTRPWHDIELRSGDLFVFGGPARLAYHGVIRTQPGSAPPEIGIRYRISITLRESGLPPDSDGTGR